MQLRRTVIYEYEQILSGRAPRFSASFEKVVSRKFNNGKHETIDTDYSVSTLNRNRKAAQILWRYVISQMMNWDVDTALACFTPALAKQLYLDRTYKYLGVAPRNADEFKEFIYLAFEKETHFDYEKKVIDIYKSVQKNTSLKFPKNFFDREDGEDAAAVILNYLVNDRLSHLSSEELYDFFNSKDVIKWLKKNRLTKVMDECYTDPLEFLHFSLPAIRRDNLSYYRILLNRKVNSAINNK